MVKKTYENHRVVVEPRSLGDFGFGSISDYSICPDPEERNARYKEICEEIKSDIKRHVDQVGSVYVDFDTVLSCSFCNCEWETDANGEPLCCDEAVDEWKNTPQTQGSDDD
jgi:hypothetical protein